MSIRDAAHRQRFGISDFRHTADNNTCQRQRAARPDTFTGLHSYRRLSSFIPRRAPASLRAAVTRHFQPLLSAADAPVSRPCTLAAIAATDTSYCH